MRVVQWVKDTYWQHSWSYVLMKPVRWLYVLLRYKIVPDKVMIKRRYQRRVGKPLDFNNLITLSEKLQWLKLYDRQEFYHQCADKFAVRQWLTRTLGTNEYLIPLYFVTSDWREIKYENMPADVPFVMKCNHDNGSWQVVKNRDEVDWKKVRYDYRRRLDAKARLWWGNREWSYKDIRPLFMVEKYLEDSGGNLLELKYFFYEGKLGDILYRKCIGGSEGSSPKYRYLKADGAPYPINYGDKSILSSMIDKVILPSTFGKMREIATVIAKHFPYHIRVDFYAIDEKIYIGELTFFDSSGYDEYQPESWNIERGARLHLKKK